jgi:hypothetical protein
MSPIFTTSLLCLVLRQASPAQPAASGESLRPDPGWKELAPNLWFDPKERRAVLRARVVFREGPLEHLLCLKGTKEHESILATNAPPRLIHAALLMTGAEPGHPVQFLPKFQPPAGSPIAIELRWLQDGQVLKSDARQWVRDDKTKKPLAIDWVFAGSFLDEDPITKKPRYGADEGDLFTVANFGNAILDLPIASSASDSERGFSARTEKIPALRTEVFVVLGPLPAPRSAPTKKGAK